MSPQKYTSAIWPTPDPGTSYARRVHGGQHYISTGLFRPTGEKAPDLHRPTSCFFDFDLVDFFDGLRRGGGAEIEKTAKERKASLYAWAHEDADRFTQWRDRFEQLVLDTVPELMGRAPTLVVDSGWGLHLHYAWRTEESCGSSGSCGWSHPEHTDRYAAAHRAIVAELNRRLRDLSHSFGADWKDAADNTCDAGTRLAREPGTLNTKSPHEDIEVSVIDGADTDIDLVYLELVAAQYTPKVVVEEPRARKPRAAGERGTSSRSGPLTSERVDFGAMVVQTERGEMTVAQIGDTLQPGERVDVVCPVAGTSIGSAFVSKDEKGRLRLTSNAASITYMQARPQKQTRTPARTLTLVPPVPEQEPQARPEEGEVGARVYAQIPEHMQRTIKIPGEGDQKGSTKLAGPQSVSSERARLGIHHIMEHDSLLDYWFDEARGVEMSGDERAYLQVEASRLARIIESDYDWGGPRGNDWFAKEINAYCYEHKRNPVQDYINSLRGKWDGVPRISHWIDRTILEPGRAAGATVDESKTGLYSAYARSFAIMLVARAMRPGCDVQNMLILYGNEGFRKTSLFKSWMPSHLSDMYSSSQIDYRNPVEAERYLGRSWLVEDSELTGRGSGEDKKAFLSKNEGSVRAMRENGVDVHPRRCVIVGTTNKLQILSDPEGTRRYWIVTCPSIDGLPAVHPSQPKADTTWLRAHRDLLLAEALAAFEAGEDWRLSPELNALRDMVAVEHTETTPLLDCVREVYRTNHGGRDNGVTVTEVAQHFDSSGSMTKEKINKMNKEITNALLTAGFKQDGKVSSGPGRSRTLWVKHLPKGSKPQVVGGPRGKGLCNDGQMTDDGDVLL